MLELQVQAAPAAVNPKSSVAPSPRGQTEELARYHAALQEAALTVLRLRVPDALRRAFWACPQFEPWRRRLACRSRKSREVQAALSLLLDSAVASRGCRASGWYFVGYKRLECLTGNVGRGGLAAIRSLQEAFLQVGLRLRWTAHHFRDRLTRTYRIDGMPEGLEAALRELGKGGLVEAPSRLDNVSSEPVRTTPAQERQARRRLQQAIEEQVARQVERMPPLRRERAELLNGAMPDLGAELRERLGQAITVAEQVASKETVAALRRIADAGRPLVSGRRRSTSARLGGAYSLGQLPSRVLRAFVGHTVEIDVTASTPSVAAAFVGDARTSQFFADCAAAGDSPVARMADAAFERLGVWRPTAEERAAGVKAAKALLISALCGGGDAAQRLHEPLAVGPGRAIAGFRAAVRQHFAASALIAGVWGPRGLAARLVRDGSVVAANGERIALPVARPRTAEGLAAQVRSAMAAAFCAVEARAIVAALRAVRASDHFRAIADKHDGLVLQRLGPARQQEELDRICAAGEAALRASGVSTRLRVRFDADYGEEPARFAAATLH